MQTWVWLCNGVFYLGMVTYIAWLRHKLRQGRRPHPNRTWRTIMEQPPQSPQERVIVQMVCALSVQDRYARLTPDEIYDKFVREADLLMAGHAQLQEMDTRGL